MQWRKEEPAPNSEPNTVDVTSNIQSQQRYTTAHVAKLIGTCHRCCQEILDINVLGIKDCSKRFNLYIFAMNVANVWLAYHGIISMADIKADL